MTARDRGTYLVAVRDTTRFTVTERNTTGDAEKALRDWWISGFTLADYEAELDKFYGDTENVRIPIVFAIRYCAVKLKGDLTKRELEQRLIALRQSF